MSDTLPTEVQSWIGKERYVEETEFPIEMGYVYTTCSSVENGNPLFWDEKVANELTDGPIAPPTMPLNVPDWSMISCAPWLWARSPTAELLTVWQVPQRSASRMNDEPNAACLATWSPSAYGPSRVPSLLSTHWPEPW